MTDISNFTGIERQWLVIPNARKHLRKECLRNWLAANHIDYTCFNNSTHFQLYIDNEIINVWPTTNKIRIGNITFTGAIVIIRKLQELYKINN